MQAARGALPRVCDDHDGGLYVRLGCRVPSGSEVRRRTDPAPAACAPGFEPDRACHRQRCHATGAEGSDQSVPSRRVLHTRENPKAARDWLGRSDRTFEPEGQAFGNDTMTRCKDSAMSSRSRSGYAARMSSAGIPSATMPTTVATGIRSLRMHGTPPI